VGFTNGSRGKVPGKTCEKIAMMTIIVIILIIIITTTTTMNVKIVGMLRYFEVLFKDNNSENR
jgi:hypothetical protein